MTDANILADLPVSSTDAVPAQFHEQIFRYGERLHERTTPEQRARLQGCLTKSHDLQRQLLRAFAGSEFVARTCTSDPTLLLSLLDSGEFERLYTASGYAAELSAQVDACSYVQALDRVLRRYRNRAMVRIVWRDFNRLAPLEETLASMSALADTCVQQALGFHYRELAARWGQPVGDESGLPQPLLVLGMGKLGAGELNVSSDIDLIFAYPESGETQGGGSGKSLSNQEFFVRLGQRLIKSLDAPTAEGFVFRVDMRLRPYGQSGALASSFSALENYYLTQGREWERYAMIKARVSACSVPVGAAYAEELMAMLRPFTYRKYIDYSVIDALRSMKALINREVQRKGMSDDVKLGYGGIREVEFIVQVFQLIRGGRDPRLRERQLLTLLPLLEAEHYLPAGRARELAAAYRFLRNTEHAIQGYQDRQTQSLPVDRQDRSRLAWVMGYGDWEQFAAALKQHRDLVNSEFQAVVAMPATPPQDQLSTDWSAFWQGDLNDEQTAALLAQHRFVEPERLLHQLHLLRENRNFAVMQNTGRERLERFMPRLFTVLSGREDAVEVFARIRPLLEAVARRSIYLMLLIENPEALNQLVKLCAASPWIADQLSRYPALLDELLDARTLYSPPDKETLGDELRQEVLRLNPDDLEGHMEALRYFRLAHSLRVAASEVTGVLPLMKVSDYLTYIAEVILEHVVTLAWQPMVARHGFPQRDDGSHCDPGFIVVGYGKLGGIELGHGSDLDLVFLHNASATGCTGARQEEGQKSIDNQTFYIRMGQKILHILTTQTVTGPLYEVDMRLRPSGNSGLLVSSLKGFKRYQSQEAWTWEHQALVRSRVVAGCPQLAVEFEREREQILCWRRDLPVLRRDVVEMRAKMRRHLGTRVPTQSNNGSEGETGNGDRHGEDAALSLPFHLKHDSGGIVDIEFMVQYAVLAWAHQEPALVRYSDNIRILGCLEKAGLLETQDVNQLIDAYKAYRSMGHRLALQRRPSVLDGSCFTAERESVKRIWRQLLGELTESD